MSNSKITNQICHELKCAYLAEQVTSGDLQTQVNPRSLSLRHRLAKLTEWQIIMDVMEWMVN